MQKFRCIDRAVFTGAGVGAEIMDNGGAGVGAENK